MPAADDPTRPRSHPHQARGPNAAGPGQAPGGRGLNLRRTTTALATSERFAWAPLVAALAIDLADFATAGPLGLVAGLFVGGLLTLTVSLAAGARPRRAMLLAILGGIYCTVPMTEAVPLATLLTLLHTLIMRGAPAVEAASEPEPVPIRARVVQAGPPRRG